MALTNIPLRIYYCYTCQKPTPHRIPGIHYNDIWICTEHKRENITPNFGLGRKVVERLMEHPEDHNQDAWWGLRELISNPDPEFGEKEGDTIIVDLEEAKLSNIPIEQVVTIDGIQTGFVKFMNACDTTMCIAGTAAVMDGVEVTQDGNGVVKYEDQWVEISPATYGMEALGLTLNQASKLFFDLNNTTALAMAREIFHV